MLSEGATLKASFAHQAACLFVINGPAGTQEQYEVTCDLVGLSLLQQVIFTTLIVWCVGVIAVSLLVGALRLIAGCSR